MIFEPSVVLAGDTTTTTAMQEVPMDRRRRPEQVFGAPGDVPGTRTVPDLEAALRLVRRRGGAIVSETRTAPGIGSWAFVADTHGGELLLWETSSSVLP